MSVLRPGFRVFVPLAVLAVAVAGCGSSKKSSSTPASSSTPTTTPAPAKAGGATVSEDMTEYKFSDAKPTAKAGTITFKVNNAGTTNHSIEVEAPSGEKKTSPVSPGSSATLKVKLKAGKYQFYCPIDGHKGLGMKGSITVQ